MAETGSPTEVKYNRAGSTSYGAAADGGIVKYTVLYSLLWSIGKGYYKHSSRFRPLLACGWRWSGELSMTEGI